jgi:anti-anti-sigma regulatory factor
MASGKTMAKLDFVCEPTGGPSAATVLRVTGELSLDNAPRLRAAALKCLADQPPAMLFDVAGLSSSDDVNLTVLIAVSRHAAAWPSIPVLVCAPSPSLFQALSRLGIDRHVMICETVAEGQARAAGHIAPVTVRHRFGPAVTSVAEARGVVEETCEQWRLGHLTDVAGLVVTELTSNVVRHARTGMELLVARSRRYLHISVRDYVRRPARLVGVGGESDAGGRGLLIVEAMTTSWGCTPTRDGKVTWASLRLP